MKTFREFISTCEGYVPLRTSDKPYDDEGFPTRTMNWSKKMTNAMMNVGKQKFRSSIGVGDPFSNLTKGVSAAARLAAMKKVDTEPESVRAQRSQEKSQTNQQLGANRRRLQTSMDRQHLTKSLKGSGTRSALTGMSSSLPSTGNPSGTKFNPGQGGRYGIGGTGLAD